MPWGACSGSRLPVRGGLLAELHVEERVAELAQHVLDLRELDELPASGRRRGSAARRAPRTRPPGRWRRPCTCVAGVSTIAPSWWPMSCGEAAQAVELRAEPGVVRVVTGETGGRDAQHEQAGVARRGAGSRGCPIWWSVDVLRFSTNTSECSTRRMSSSRASGRRGSMVHDSLLRAIELFIAWRLYGRSSTPSTAARVHREQAAEQHVRIGTGEVALRGGREHRRVLDPDHLGAEVGEQLREVRARPHRGEVEDPDAAQRWLVGARGALTRRRVRAAHLDARCSAWAAWGRGGAAASRPRRGGTARPGRSTCPRTGSSQSTQKPRW